MIFCMFEMHGEISFGNNENYGRIANCVGAHFRLNEVNAINVEPFECVHFMSMVSIRD